MNGVMVAHQGIHWVRRLHLICVIIFIVFIGVKAVDGDPAAHDGEQNFLMAYNFLNAGVMSLDKSGLASGLAATNYREPLYPLLLSASMKILLPSPLPDLSCFRENNTACAVHHEHLKMLNIVTLTLLLIALYILIPPVASEIGLTFLQGQWTAIALVSFLGLGSSYLSKIEFYYSDALAGLLVLLHATGLLMVMCQNKKSWAAVCGLALAGLVLTKAIFFYWMPILCIFFFVKLVFSTQWQQQRRLVILLLILCSSLPVLAWMARNSIEVGQFSVSSGRDSRVMGVRAEYDAMRWEEYLTGYVYFVPVYGWAAVEDLFEEKNYRRYVRDNPDSFFTVGQSEEGLVGQQIKKGWSVYGATLSIFIEHLPMHLANSVLMTYRSFFIPAGVRTLRVKVGALSNWMTLTTFAIHVTLVPSFLFMLGWSIYSREWPLVIFLVPAVFSIALHLGVTHYIPRYNSPIIPLLFFSQVVLLYRLWDFACSRIKKPEDQV